MGDSVWIRTEGGNWYPGKVSSKSVKRGPTRQVAKSFPSEKCLNIDFGFDAERGIVLSRHIPQANQEAFCSIEWGD